ncbi:hypothetical protein SMC26_21895 [Actinomadura fulvescens]|uniref:NTP pyrophosphohydrolase MazG putative catalytic core domain-containing protein n=1 Tax=Actinomadura fulvescens TaxID=46160 RepID=A0ABP6CZG3_9ACTN
MTLDQLAAWAAGQADGLAAQKGLQDDGDLFLALQNSKLGEEAGELQGAVLAYLNYQRDHKLDGFSTADVASEVADVVICAAILAARTGVDLGAALADKIEKVSRYV